jgi:ubiquitin-protein ligase
MSAATLVSDKFVKKDALRRIISDIKELIKNPLTAHGIYYEHDETDMLCGKAMIIGPKDTPYADGFYLFKLKLTKLFCKSYNRILHRSNN